MVISILGDEESVISAITVGATGYLLKDAFPTNIAATVRDLVAGHFCPRSRSNKSRSAMTIQRKVIALQLFDSQGSISPDRTV